MASRAEVLTPVTLFVHCQSLSLFLGFSIFSALSLSHLSLYLSPPSHIIRSEISQKGLSQVMHHPSTFHTVVWIWRLRDIVIWCLTRTSSISSLALDYL